MLVVVEINLNISGFMYNHSTNQSSCLNAASLENNFDKTRGRSHFELRDIRQPRSDGIDLYRHTHR